LLIFVIFIATENGSSVIVPFQCAPEHLFLNRPRDQLRPSHCGLSSNTGPLAEPVTGSRGINALRQSCSSLDTAEVSTSVHARKHTTVCLCTGQDKRIYGWLRRMKSACIGWYRLALAVYGREVAHIRECVPLTSLTV